MIVGCTQYPGELTGIGVKLDGSDVVQVPQQGEQATAEFVIPNFDFVVIAAGDDQWFEEVEVDTADGSVVFFEAVDYGAYAVVPSFVGEKQNRCER